MTQIDQDFIKGFDVLLINPPYPRRVGGGIVPPIGLCYLAAALKGAGARPLILDLVTFFPTYSFKNIAEPAETIRSILRMIKLPRHSLIGVGPLVTATLKSTKHIIEVCREESDQFIVIGGPLCSVPGISNVVKEYLGADFFIAGDGETPIVELWKSLTSKKFNDNIVGLGFPGKREPVSNREENLDSLPLPARELLNMDFYKSSARRQIEDSNMTSAFLSRGCPYSCTFCAAPLSSGKRVRRLSPNKISQEISACGDLGIEHIIFYDDCLFVKSPSLNKSVTEFTRAIRNSSWSGTFQLELRCDAVLALSNEAFKELEDVGCRQINMGIEKGHVAILNQIRKKLSPQMAREACDRISLSNIRGAGTFIIGGPNETSEDIEKTIDFAVSLPLDFAHFNPLAIYPGTALYNEVFGSDNGARWLDLCLDEAMAPLGDILWRSSNISLETILTGVKNAYRRFYTESRLEKALKRLPKSDEQSIIESYHLLMRDRAKSWKNKTLISDFAAEIVSC